ncbi:hypothetical protein GSI_05524 [Ganoderma sinense ZZ0214-1]|uniref:Uncharacterized protein n=1 Tax=Ganoderma sinense ZZ0214-1 TaxID=1077348 RepID=A0A2G8SET6_9APHY|nr:hypothetical protein GSI_05524 [Ganoderma sinense ZZ0214-1]
MWAPVAENQDSSRAGLTVPGLFLDGTSDQSSGAELCPQANTMMPMLTNRSEDFPISELGGEWYRSSGPSNKALHKKYRIKIHDYAFDWRPSVLDSRVPELWFTAVDDLIQHDHYIRVHSPLADQYRLTGKKLYHLLNCGWVTLREATQNWRQEDWEAVANYEDRLTGPYPVRIPRSVNKPSTEERAALRVTRYNPMDETIPEANILSAEGGFPTVIAGLPRPVDKRLLGPQVNGGTSA